MAQILALALLLFAGACHAAPNRIVGGDLTTIEYFTSIAQVEFQGVTTGNWGQSCACSILNSRNVISAAHCFEGSTYDPARRRVRAGATFRNTGGIVSQVEREFNHPTYGQLGFDGDISVVRLLEPLVYSPVVQQVTVVAQGTTIPDNIPVVHAGWGTTSQGGTVSNQLQQVTIYTINNELCRQRYATANQLVTENMICAGILDVGGKDACQGDSGGPLYYENILIGIVSWGIGCAHAFYPGVSTAVAPYTDWVVSIAQSTCHAAPNRIVGGDITGVEYFTSIAQIEFQAVATGTWSQSCACSILTSRHVLSAAHCFEGLQYAPSRRRVRAGATYRNTGGVLSNVEVAFNHPSYGQLGMDGDISVVRLIQPLVYSAVIQQAVIVAQGTFIPESLPVVYAGWGTTSATGPVSNQLQQVTTFTINNNLCRERYATVNHFVTENMICAGILDVGGRDACLGDSGGPLYFDNFLVGVISWGIGCADPFFPGVSSAVGSYTNWIVSIAET